MLIGNTDWISSAIEINIVSRFQVDRYSILIQQQGQRLVSTSARSQAWWTDQIGSSICYSGTLPGPYVFGQQGPAGPELRTTSQGVRATSSISSCCSGYITAHSRFSCSCKFTRLTQTLLFLVDNFYLYC